MDIFTIERVLNSIGYGGIAGLITYGTMTIASGIMQSDGVTKSPIPPKKKLVASAIACVVIFLCAI